jgi:hypothetical protein
VQRGFDRPVAALRAGQTPRVAIDKMAVAIESIKEGSILFSVGWQLDQR